jgi:hypothetical protein
VPKQKAGEKCRLVVPLVAWLLRAGIQRLRSRPKDQAPLNTQRSNRRLDTMLPLAPLRYRATVILSGPTGVEPLDLQAHS